MEDPCLYLSLTDVLALLANNLVDNSAVVQAVDEVVPRRPHEGSLQSTEQDPVQFLHIVLPHLLQEENQAGRNGTLLCLAYGLKTTQQVSQSLNDYSLSSEVLPLLLLLLIWLCYNPPDTFTWVES